MPAALDLSGKRYGRLVAKLRIKGSRNKQSGWECMCDCGNKKFVKTELLVKGKVRSCGCLRKEVVSLKNYVSEKEGNRYGKLIVKERSGEIGENRYVKWICICDCGKEIRVSGKNLRNGNTTSCGCVQKEKMTKKYAVNIEGQRFGRLLAIEPIIGAKYSNGRAKRQWLCKCDCGKKVLQTVGMLRSKNVRSCGCLMRELAPRNFHNEGFEAYKLDPEYSRRESLIYFVEVQHTCDKIGIAFDLEKRSRGDYSEIWWTKEMPRAHCWAAEQVALLYTKDWAAQDIPKNLCVGGVTEFRLGLVIEDTIELLEDLCEECLKLGWQNFYKKHIFR